jgi:sugar diacid utilization regulator
MARQASSARAVAAAAHVEALRAIAGKLQAQREQVARQVVDRFRTEIVDYRAPSDPALLDEAFSAALAHVDALVTSLETSEPIPEDYFDLTREMAARRVHQGVPLESFLHAARLWATVAWYTVLSVARPDSRYEREAALEIAGIVMDLADRISTVATQSYLDEITDRGLIRRDLLDALLTADGDGNYTTRLARRLHLHLEDNYVVVVVRGEGVEVEEARQQPPAARNRLDRIVEETRRVIRPASGSPLTGLRNGDLVVLYPAASPSELDAVRADCRRLAAALGDDVTIGMSGWHEGRATIGTSYAEAKDAVAIAARLGITGRAVGLDEVLVDKMLESSESARQTLEAVLRPLLAYDASRQAALIPTLRAYIAARFNITKAAETLFVNPNTVVYRLRRIHELSGRDPHDVDDLFVLYLALELQERLLA